MPAQTDLQRWRQMVLGTWEGAQHLQPEGNANLSHKEMSLLTPKKVKIKNTV